MSNTEMLSRELLQMIEHAEKHGNGDINSSILKSVITKHAALSAQSAVQEPLCWVPEDELPESMPSDAYNALYPHSRVDFIREFPIYGPHPSSAAQVEEIPAAANESYPFDDQYSSAYKAGWNGYRKALLEIRALKTPAPSKGEGS